MAWSTFLFLTLSFVFVSNCQAQFKINSYSTSISEEDDNFNKAFGLNTSELVKLHGYNATDFFITSQDGYILNLVRVTNPLINNGQRGHNNKEVILFVHGTGTSGSSFIIRGSGIEPKNLAHIDAGKMPLETLIEQFNDEPASKSLAYTALNFGHEVWLLNRRGTTYSLGHSNKMCQPFYDPLRELLEKTGSIVSNMPFMNKRRRRKREQKLLEMDIEEAILSVLRSPLVPTVDIRPINFKPNPCYWNFSLDEQALYDLPEAMNFILKKTGRSKMAVVGHSAGASMILMLLSDRPEEAKKFSKAILWGPAYEPSSMRSFLNSLAVLPMINNKKEPIISPPMLNSIFRTLSFLFCQRKEIRANLCGPAGEFAFGPGKDQTELRAGFYTAVMETVSTGEIASLTQSAFKGKMYHADHGRASNIRIYGQPRPPAYNVSRITLKDIDVWAGSDDIITTMAGAKKLVQDIGLPINAHYIEEEGVIFNHVAFLFHKNNSRLVVLPCLKSLETKLV